MSASIQQQFTTWVRSKPADEEYNPWDASACALAQFGCPGVTGDNYQASMPYAVFWAALDAPHTFGALLTRLEASA